MRNRLTSGHAFLFIPLIAGLLLGSLFLNVSTVFACSCIANLPLQSHIDRADAIFAGKAIRVNEKSGLMTFEVSEVWKGRVEKRFTIMGAGDSAACGWNPEVGKEYLIYAHQESDTDPGQYGTNLCSRNKLIADADQDLALLKVGEAPRPTTPPSSLGMFAVFIAIGVFISGCFITIVRLRRV